MDCRDLAELNTAEGAWLHHKSGFFLDTFSANRVFDFAETLSFCLEFLVFSLSY